MVVSTRGWSALLQQHQHMSVPYSQQMGPLVPLGCTPLSPMGVLPVHLPHSQILDPPGCLGPASCPLVGPGWRNQGQRLGIQLRPLSPRLLAPYKNGVSLTHKELMEQQSLAESQGHDPCYPYAVLRAEHTCYPHCHPERVQ